MFTAINTESVRKKAFNFFYLSFPSFFINPKMKLFFIIQSDVKCYYFYAYICIEINSIVIQY